MNCDLFKETVSDLAKRDLIGDDVQIAALDHAKGCESCARRLRDEEWLVFGLRAMAESAREQEAPARVELQLREAFRADRGINVRANFRAQKGQRALSRLGSRFSWSRLAIGAAAALAAIALLTATFQKEQTEKLSEREVQVAGPQKTPEAKNDNPVPAPVAGHIQPSTPKRLDVNHRSGRQRRGSTSPVSREVATEFIPVMYGQGLAPTEGGRLIRVELPRSALWAYGLPMNVDRAGARIKADVVVGNDGMARAIRFVQ